MKYVDEFRNTEICLKLAAKISKIASNTDTITLMEVCGTHTMSIARYGIKNLLPKC
jgi:Hydrogenase maturation factor